MVAPMGVYLGLNSCSRYAAGRHPHATDIAAGLYNFFKNRMPRRCTFLLTLATVDDLGAIAVIAVLREGIPCPRARRPSAARSSSCARRR